MKTMSAVLVAMLTATLGAQADVAAAQGRGRGPGPDLSLLQGGGGGLGVTVRDLTPDEARRAALDRPGGVFVERVREESAASRAGIRSGDIIVEFDGERIRGVLHFSRLVLETPAGRAVRATVARDGARQTIEVTPEEGSGLQALLPEIRREIERRFRSLPDDLELGPLLPQRGTRASLGVTLTSVSEQLAAYFGVKNGALVTDVDADSAASRAGIRAGDVLTSVAGRSIATPADVAAALRGTDSSTIDIVLMRDRREVTVKATLPDREPGPGRRTVPI